MAVHIDQRGEAFHRLQTALNGFSALCCLRTGGSVGFQASLGLDQATLEECLALMEAGVAHFEILAATVEDRRLRVEASALRPAPDLGNEETRIFDRVANLAEEERIVLMVSPRELLDRAERDLLRGLTEAP